MDKITYQLKPKSLVSADERKQLNKLHYQDGLMMPRFKRYAGSVILAKNNLNQVVGWAFIYKFPKEKNRIIYLYISSKWRRKGIGSTMFEMAKEKYSKLEHYWHDNRSKQFFESVE